MKCPYRTTKAIETKDRKIKMKDITIHYVEEETGFGNCYGNDCPYYEITKTGEECRRCK